MNFKGFKVLVFQTSLIFLLFGSDLNSNIAHVHLADSRFYYNYTEHCVSNLGLDFTFKESSRSSSYEPRQLSREESSCSSCSHI